MSCQSRISSRIIAPALCSVALLAGCSDIYFDRREGVTPAAGQCGGGKPRGADDRSVVAGERQQEHRLPRRENANRGRALPSKPRHSAGRTTTLGRLSQQQAQQAGPRRLFDHDGFPKAIRNATVPRLIRATTKKTRVLVLTADPGFEQSVRSTFGVSPQIELRVISASIAVAGDEIDPDGLTVMVIDLDNTRDDEMAALERLTSRTGGWPPVVVVTQGFNASIARSLMQMRVADFLVKPVPPVDLVQTCARVTKPTMTDASEAEIYTFLAAVGGAGATTLAIQTALLLLSSGKSGRGAACLVDLNFQHGACADYLDLEPRLDLKEIEPRPERLDRQLLEVMLSYHASGRSR